MGPGLLPLNYVNRGARLAARRGVGGGRSRNGQWGCRTIGKGWMGSPRCTVYVYVRLPRIPRDFRAVWRQNGATETKKKKQVRAPSVVGNAEPIRSSANP